MSKDVDSNLGNISGYIDFNIGVDKNIQMDHMSDDDYDDEDTNGNVIKKNSEIKQDETSRKVSNEFQSKKFKSNENELVNLEKKVLNEPSSKKSKSNVTQLVNLDLNLSRFVKKLLDNLDNETNDSIEYRQSPEIRFDNDLDLDLNVKFFRNEIAALPNRETLSEIFKNWKDNYDLLEENHAYIQWLFPIYSQGMNHHSHPLQLHEYLTLKSDSNTKELLLESFDMMLRFYGFKLNKTNAIISRRNQYKSRYANLIRRQHNNLRISRILKCLGDFNMEVYQYNWITFLLNEIFIERKLIELADSFTRFWVHTIKDDTKRNTLKDKLRNILIESEL